jgi:hypothetical protein
MGFYAFKRPYNNWDMLAYAGVVIGYDHNNPEYVHDTVYKIAKDQLPETTLHQLVNGAGDFRKRMAGNSQDFNDQMPYYLVKPLYTGLIYLLFKSGLPLLRAILLPSFIFYVLIGILLLFWLKKYLSFLIALVLSALIMITVPMWEIARCSSPDGMSVFFLFLSMYLILEKHSLLLVCLILGLSVTTRLDNIIPAFFLITLLKSSGKWPGRISLGKYFLILGGFCLIFFMITLPLRRWGWSPFYYPTFLKSMNLSYVPHAQFEFREYRSLFLSQMMTAIFSSQLILFLLLALLVISRARPFRVSVFSLDQLFLSCILLTILVRFLLQPVGGDRFFAAYYLVILVLFIKNSLPIQRAESLGSRSLGNDHG